MKTTSLTLALCLFGVMLGSCSSTQKKAKNSQNQNQKKTNNLEADWSDIDAVTSALDDPSDAGLDSLEACLEAAVGAGISTVLMLGTLSQTSVQERKAARLKILPLVVVVLTGAALVYGTLDMPHFGDENAPIHRHVAPEYIAQNVGTGDGTAAPRSDFGESIPNLVTAAYWRIDWIFIIHTSLNISFVEILRLNISCEINPSLKINYFLQI